MTAGPFRRSAVAAAVLAAALGCAGEHKEGAPATRPTSGPQAIDVQAELGAGRSARGEGRLGDAGLHFERVVRADPSSYDARVELAETLLQRSVDLGRVRTLLDEAQALRPGDERVDRLRGWLDELQGDTAAAAADYARVLERTPDPELRIRRANLLLRSNLTDLAVQEFERAAAERTADRAVRTTLAELYEHQGRTADAAEMLRQVAALAPTDPAPERRLAAFYRRHGELARAREAEGRARALEGSPRALRPLRPSKR